ncbi:MAG: hypothetical protein LUH22_06960 [Bacteroides sp.]|nr:hypothetical protein [Bacteroides sp.]
MFGFKNSKVLFDINDLTGEFGIKQSEIVQYRINKGFTVTSQNGIVSARKKYKDIGTVIISNFFYTTKMECTIGVQYKTEYNALFAALTPHCERVKFAINNLSYSGYKLPNGDFLRDASQGGIGIEFKIYPKEEVNVK